ncbi:hypothetical protein niasHT_022415 [Heterodera trifolii]|uniref:Carbohydrate kinase FGGY N-terminal domain-containing protein n=1 Tax=Heterodera trifolii TaxID=157864 RepID=A0ABD2KMR3_9BILA
MPFFLGIDLGTTSVKIALIDGDKKTFLEWDRKHNALIEREEKDRHEQSPKKILDTVQKLLGEMETDKLAQVKGIGISGQMHGVMLWETDSIGLGVDRCHCSPLITWMDSRCDEQFLRTLPKWLDGNDPQKEKRIATGYGMATLAWLKEKGQLDGEKWDRAGTIMDFMASLLTQSKSAFISSQNAESWGFVSDFTWTRDGCNNRISRQNPITIIRFRLWPKIRLIAIPITITIPIRHIPDLDRPTADKLIDVLPLFPISFYFSSRQFPHSFAALHLSPGTFIGRTSLPFGHLPKGVPVTVPLGDLQASLLPFLSSGVAVLHIGTASQIAFVSQRSAEEMSPKVVLPNSIRRDPFFDDDFLLVAPSLNGGNVFAGLFQPKDDEVPPVKVMPTFFGERHISAQEGGAVVENWRMDTPIEQFIVSIARGIVANLAQMMPPAVLAAHSVHTLKLIGRANQNVFAEEAKRHFPAWKLSSKNRICLLLMARQCTRETFT